MRLTDAELSVLELEISRLLDLTPTSLLSLGCILSDPSFPTITTLPAYIAHYGRPMADLVVKLSRLADHGRGCRYLIAQQFILKPADSKKSQFPPHKDCHSLPIHTQHTEPYWNVWVSTVDISLENGPLFIEKGRVFGIEDGTGGCLVKDDEEGRWETALVERGVPVVFECCRWHYSTPNVSETARPAFMPQFSNEPLMQAIPLF